MKRFLIVVSILFAASMGYCDGVWRSSSTLPLANAFEKTLCDQYIVNGASIPKRGVLHSVIVSSPSNNSLTSVCNSSFTTVNGKVCVGPIVTTTARQIMYDVIFTSGIIYTSTGTAGVEFIYNCY